MKNNIICIFSLLLLLSNGCKKEIIQEEIIFPIFDSGPKIYGNLTALKNGVKWEASGFNWGIKTEDGVNTIGVSAYTYFDNNYTDLYIKEHMSFGHMLPKVGKYKLVSFKTTFKEGEAMFLYGYDEHDVTVNPFELVQEADNFVEITKLDSLHIEGRFDVTCKGKYKIKGVTHIYRFSEGKFNVLFRK